MSVTKRCGEDTRVGRAGCIIPGKDFDDWGCPFRDYGGTHDLVQNSRLKDSH